MADYNYYYYYYYYRFMSWLVFRNRKKLEERYKLLAQQNGRFECLVLYW